MRPRIIFCRRVALDNDGNLSFKERACRRVRRFLALVDVDRGQLGVSSPVC
jgi:hypothetical protein